MIAVDAVRHVEHVMGTAVSFDVRTTDGDERHARQLIANACAVLHADDRTFSPWREDSAVSRVQRGELALWDAPADVIVVFDRCQHARRVSGGSFDPWTPDRRFDPTGLVKGWSAMRALHELEAAGITAAVVNAGGDIAAFGEPEPGRAWRFGIPDPADTRGSGSRSSRPAQSRRPAATSAARTSTTRSAARATRRRRRP